MNQIFEALIGQLEAHWIKILTGLALTGLGWVIGVWRAKRQWAKKEFLDRLNISLNTFDEGVLKIRTIQECEGEEVFLNKNAAKRVTKLAKKTTLEDPLLPIDKDDYWFYLNSVLNVVSEQFAEGFLKRDMGLAYDKQTYLIALTSEAAGLANTRKVRAMLIQKEALLNLPEQIPDLESQSHETRWDTLILLKKAYEKRSWCFLEVEICL